MKDDTIKHVPERTGFLEGDADGIPTCDNLVRDGACLQTSGHERVPGRGCVVHTEYSSFVADQIRGQVLCLVYNHKHEMGIGLL